MNEVGVKLLRVGRLAVEREHAGLHPGGTKCGALAQPSEVTLEVEGLAVDPPGAVRGFPRRA